MKKISIFLVLLLINFLGFSQSIKPNFQLQDSTNHLTSNFTLIKGKIRDKDFKIFKDKSGNYVVKHKNKLTSINDNEETIEGIKKKKVAKREKPFFTPHNVPPLMIPNDSSLKGKSSPYPETGYLEDNQGYSSIDVVVSYAALTQSGLSSDAYTSKFLLRFTQVTQFHAEANNKIRLRNLIINTTPDGFNGAGASARMSQLRLAYPNSTAHNTMLIDAPNGNGGVAWLGTACSTVYSSYRYSYCAISLGNSTFPNYSYDTYCMSHELGHAFGLNHAFWCGWELKPGLFGAIDSTASAESYNGVRCFTSPKASNAYDIMGYNQLWSSSFRPKWTNPTKTKLTNFYTNAITSGCITGTAPVVIKEVDSVRVWKNGLNWNGEFLSDGKSSYTIYLSSYSSYKDSTKAPTDNISFSASSIRNGWNNKKATTRKISLVPFIPQPSTKGIWYAMRIVVNGKTYNSYFFNK